MIWSQGNEFIQEQYLGFSGLAISTRTETLSSLFAFFLTLFTRKLKWKDHYYELKLFCEKKWLFYYF